mgnify:CR=1 FL=1
MKIIPFGFLLISCIAYGETVLFQDNFDGSPGAVLNNRTPDIGQAAWVAGDSFKADGSVTGETMATATVAFNPRSGNIYQLDVRFDCESLGTKWIGAGFSKGQSAESDNRLNRFSKSSQALTTGQAWAILKGDPDQTTPNGNTAHANGTRNAAAFSGDLEVYAGIMDVRIVLDTTKQSWTATWYAKPADDADFTLVRPTMDLMDRNIDSVGLISNQGKGRFEYFSLKAVSESPVNGRSERAPPQIKSSPNEEPQTLGLITG